MMSSIKLNGICSMVMWLATLTAYGQQLLFTDPVPLESINSEAEDIAPLPSPDGRSLYFVRAFHENNVGGSLAGSDVWVAKKDSTGMWSRPLNTEKVWNNRENNAVVGIRNDSKVIYLLNGYFRDKGVAFSKLLSDQWIKPELLPFKWIERQQFVGVYMHPDFNVLLLAIQGEDSQGQEDIYISLKDSTGHWSKPRNLGPTINTEGFETSPFLSKDKKRLYFASNGHGGYGDADIFVSERLYDNWTVWSKPENLGDKINSEAFDAYLTIGEDSTVYFSSSRDRQQADIYTCKVQGVSKAKSKQYAEQLIREAQQLLSELRGEHQSREYFIEFPVGSEEIKDQQKLNDLVKFLNYQSYEELVLLSVAYEPVNLNIHEKRLDKITNFLKLSGINKSKIKIRESSSMPRGAQEKLFDEKDGIIVIVSYK